MPGFCEGGNRRPVGFEIVRSLASATERRSSPPKLRDK